MEIVTTSPVTVGEEGWRERFTRMRWVVARHDRRIVGMASSVRVAGRPAYERHIESVWVDPRYRRTGVLRAILRPSVRGLSWPSWRAVIVLGVAMAGMNLSFYYALRTLPLGIAVTVEFVGPLVLALVQTSRRSEAQRDSS